MQSSLPNESKRTNYTSTSSSGNLSCQYDLNNTFMMTYDVLITLLSLSRSAQANKNKIWHTLFGFRQTAQRAHTRTLPSNVDLWSKNNNINTNEKAWASRQDCLIARLLCPSDKSQIYIHIARTLRVKWKVKQRKREAKDTLKLQINLILALYDSIRLECVPLISRCRHVKYCREQCMHRERIMARKKPHAFHACTSVGGDGCGGRATASLDQKHRTFPFILQCSSLMECILRVCRNISVEQTAK